MPRLCFWVRLSRELNGDGHGGRNRVEQQRACLKAYGQDPRKIGAIGEFQLVQCRKPYRFHKEPPESHARTDLC